MILLIIIIGIIGRQFYQLAFEYNKKEWVYAVIGGGSFIVTYFGGAFLFGILIAIMGWFSILEMNPIVLELIMYSIAALVCTIVYFSLKRSWSKQAEAQSKDVIDSSRDL